MESTKEYNAGIRLNALRNIANGDLIAARLLWNLGLSSQAIWLLQQSIEKYLKYLWAKKRIFESEADLDKQLKDNFNHKIEKIFDELDLKYKKNIKNPIFIIALSALRYKGSFGYSYQMFRCGEKFVHEIRALLAEKKYSNHFEEWKNAPMRLRFNYNKEAKAEEVVKSILSLTNPRTKKERLKDKRRFDFILSKFFK